MSVRKLYPSHSYSIFIVPPSIEHLRKRLQNRGSETSEIIEKRLEIYQHPSNSYKGIIAILSLAKVYGKIELDLALDYALSINATNVKSITSIISLS